MSSERAPKDPAQTLLACGTAHSGRVPIATISILLLTGCTTALQFVFPSILTALERSPGFVLNHQWWRLITPLLVHSDGWRQIGFNFPAILVVGVPVERIFGWRGFLLLYLACGLVGEIAGYAWHRYGAGASLGGAGVLGALAFWLLARSAPGKIGGTLLLLGAATLCGIRDVHGPPLLAGACLAWIMCRRQRVQERHSDAIDLNERV